MVTNIAAGAAGAALENEDYDRADEILGRFRNEMDPDTYWKLARVSKKHTEAKEFDSLAHEIFSKPGVWEGNHFNEAKALEYVNELYGPNVTKRIGGAIKNKEDFFAAVAGQESGGNYNAQNGRTGAFGKYQIMPENWPSWAQEAGLSADAPQTPENQEIVAKYKLGQYYDELGAEGALVAWYAGYRNGERWRDGEADAIGEGGHYSWDARQGNGDEPSIREYVQQALGRAGGAERTVSAYDPEKRDHLMKLVSALGKDAEQAYQQQRGQYLDGIMRAAQSAGSYSAAISMLYAQDLDMKERNTLEGQIAEYYHVNRSTGRAIGSGRSGTNNGKSWSKAYPEEAKALNRFAEHLRKGTTITKAELLEARRAGNLYADLGYLSEEDAADLELYENSSEMRSQVTDFIERRGLGGAFEEMLDMGGTPTANIIILSKALPYYLDDNFQGIIDEEG